MMYRKKMHGRKDRRIFTKTADRGKSVNINPGCSRGGILF